MTSFTIDIGNVVVAARGETFEIHCMDCGWHLSGAPTAKAASNVGMAHMSTHDLEGRHQPHGFVMIGRKGGEMIYRRKPVEVEARHFTESNGAELAEWCGGEFFPDPMKGRGGTWGDYISVPTPRGSWRADLGDWIISEGDSFYPVTSDVFEAGFESVSVS